MNVDSFDTYASAPVSARDAALRHDVEATTVDAHTTALHGHTDAPSLHKRKYRESELHEECMRQAFGDHGQD